MIRLLLKNKPEEYEQPADALKRIITIFRINPVTFNSRFLGIQSDKPAMRDGALIAKVLEKLVLGQDPTEIRNQGLLSLLESPKLRAKIERINNYRNKQ